MSDISYIAWGSAEQYLDHASDIGLDIDAALREAGIETIPSDPETTIPGRAFERLLQNLILQSQSPLFGLDTSKYIKTKNYNVIGYIAMNSETVAEALFKAMRYQSLIGGMGEFEIHPRLNERHIEVRWTSSQIHPNVKKHLIDSVLGSGLSYVRWLSGVRVAPVAVNFECSEPESKDELDAYEALFACPLIFNSEFSSLIIDIDTMNLPIPHPNQHLLSTLESYAESKLGALEEPTIVDQVSLLIRNNLSSGRLTKETIAAELSMNPRTLQRRLTDEGTTYQSVLNDVRMMVASELLGHSTSSLQEVATESGYSDVRSFHYAFRKSMEITPRAFRKSFAA